MQIQKTILQVILNSKPPLHNLKFIFKSNLFMSGSVRILKKFLSVHHYKYDFKGSNLDILKE